MLGLKNLWKKNWETKVSVVSCILLFSSCPLFSTPPQWWTERNVIRVGAEEENYKAVNIGQAKWMVVQAHAELSERLAPFGGIDFDVVDLFPPVPDSPNQEWLREQAMPLNIGQLKYLAKPFYDNLNRVSPAFLEYQARSNGIDWEEGQVYPWSDSSPIEENYRVANIGQLKSVFAFRVREDSDNDELPDFWELAHTAPSGSTDSISSSIALLHGSSDTDGDFVSDFEEYIRSSDPLDATSGVRDKDGDGLPDSFEELLIVFIPEYSTLEDVRPEGDADGDGVSNLDEFTNGLSGYEFDTDGDGYSDALSIDLELHYRFNDGELNPIVDSSGNDNNGASALASVNPEGIEVQSITLGQENAVVTAPADALRPSSDFSMALWFKSSQEEGSQTVWSTLSSNQSEKSSFTLFNNSVVQLELPNEPRLEWTIGRQLADSLWHQVVLTRDETNNELILYIDGQLIGSPQSVLTGFSDIGSIVFGQALATSSSYTPSLDFNGDLDEIRIYSRVLALEEITELFQVNDIDGDRIPDDFELSLTGGLSAIDGSIGSVSDFDIDGVLDFQEWEEGTLRSDFLAGVNIAVSVISGANQRVNSGSITRAPIVFEVTRDGVIVPDAPVQLDAFGQLGELFLPNTGSLGRQRELRTDSNGRVSVFFRAN